MISERDRVEIEDLYARQSHAVDEGDADGWAATYTADGVFESPTFALVARGTRELAAFVDLSYRRAAERGDQLRHLVNAKVFTENGDDLGVRAYLMIVATSAEGSRIDRMLVIEDVLRHTPDGWRFASRTTCRDQPLSPVQGTARSTRFHSSMPSGCCCSSSR